MTKEAGAHLYLIEELGDARVRCDQLVRYLNQAAQLVEKSTHRDHFFEVAGDLIHALPITAFKLQKALNAVALAAARMDYEELKQDLRPAKVQELEKVLDEVRIRQVQRRSDPLTKLTPKAAAEELRLLAKLSREAGDVMPYFAVAQLILDLETGSKEAAESGTPGDMLDRVAESLEGQNWGKTGPSRKILTALLRRMLGDAHIADSKKVDDMTTNPWKVTAEEDEKKSRFEEGKPADPTENMSKEDAAQWKAEHAKNKDKFKTASEDEEKKSRFEEGKPADPTENMSKEDAAQWKAEHAKNKDKFKGAAVLSPDVKLELETAALVLRNASKGQQPKKNAIIAVRSLGMALAKMGEERAYEVLWRAADIMQASGMWDLAGKEGSEDEEKQSKFEEGKPADPTENMSEEDAKKWRLEHLKNKDNFSKDASWKADGARKA